MVQKNCYCNTKCDLMLNITTDKIVELHVLVICYHNVQISNMSSYQMECGGKGWQFDCRTITRELVLALVLACVLLLALWGCKFLTLLSAQRGGTFFQNMDSVSQPL